MYVRDFYIFCSHFQQCKCGPKGDCICNKGFVRSKLGGTCIPIDKCPKNDCCGDNEEPTTCGNVCIEPNCPVWQTHISIKISDPHFRESLWAALKFMHFLHTKIV